MRFVVVKFLLIFTLFSCKNGNKVNILAFREGEFKTSLEESDEISTFQRKGNIQIETYRNQTDTFTIQWKSNFEYQLLKLHPKSKLDSTPFIVKITNIKSSSYEFVGSFLGSDFKQKGKSIKLK